MKISYHLVAVYNYQAFAAYAILKLLCEEVVEARLCVVFFGGGFFDCAAVGAGGGAPRPILSTTSRKRSPSF
ncbi:hypothetical protein midi_01257 [Candidatus Midichloria mitochondrii IricVA]|uniref:Uncharacterized protein n=1 Tax=Midichloria mitochondrii (strain IricVA) TaxID=696127 RepID=F7XUG9_MIDMI|nr:hypothetical protein midi_01257 [Candidatus Midichloria mitochondrii IricVA]